MTKTIDVTCDKHGKVTLKPSGAHVTVRNPGKITVEFFSLCCKRYQVTEIQANMVEQLRAIGVQIQLLDVPAEARENRTGPPICLAEVNVWLMEIYDSRPGHELQVPTSHRPLIGRRG